MLGTQSGEREEPPDSGAVLGAMAAARLFQTSNALNFQFVLALEIFAAASESLSFSAYPQIADAREAPVLEDADSNDDRDGDGVDAASGWTNTGGGGTGDDHGEGEVGVGGGSMADWFVIPFQTLEANRAAKVD